MLNIHRIDHDGSRTHCWRVIVQRRRRSYGRSFSDRRYGGSQAALVAAKGYRDEVIRSNPALSKPVYCAILKRALNELTRQWHHAQVLLQSMHATCNSLVEDPSAWQTIFTCWSDLCTAPQEAQT